MNATTDLIRRYYAAFNARNWEAMLACLADEVQHHVNEGSVRQGKVTFREFLAHMEQCYDERLADMTVMTDASGARAAAEFVVHGRYVTTDDGLPPARGQSYVLPAGAFLDVHDGRIARITTYYNLQHWLKQIV